MNIFFEIHKDNPREGPGDRESTIRALSAMEGLPGDPLILDLGCGPGAQTIDLAEAAAGRIVAVDNHRPFLGQLRAQALARDLSGRISAVCASMFEPCFAPGSFDAVWSEGAIYQIGFDRGLREWKRLLKPGGYMAVTEISWFRGDLPHELSAHWLAEYPGIRSVQENLRAAAGCGYTPVDHFPLPESAWWEGYYRSIIEKLPLLEELHGHDPEAMECIRAEKREMELLERYSDYYGYEFYILRN